MRPGYIENGRPTDKAINELYFFKGFEGLPIATLRNMDLRVADGKLCLPYSNISYPSTQLGIKSDLEMLNVPIEKVEFGKSPDDSVFVNIFDQAFVIFDNVIDNDENTEGVVIIDE